MSEKNKSEKTGFNDEPLNTLHGGPDCKTKGGEISQTNTLEKSPLSV